MNYDEICKKICTSKKHFNISKFYKFIKDDDNFNLILQICKDNNLEYNFVKPTIKNKRGFNTNYIVLSKVLKGENIRCPFCNDIITKINRQTCRKKECILKSRKQTNLKKYGVEHTTQSKEIKEKTKKTNLERYGVEYVSQNDKVKEKVKKTLIKTNQKLYNVDYSVQRNDVKNKIKKNNLEKYGVEYPLQSKEIINKIEETNMKKYGVKNPFQSKKIQDKIKETNLKKYGVDNPIKTKEVRDKMKKTLKENYGVEYPIQSKEIQDKIKKTNLERYGIEYASQNKDIRSKTEKTNLERYGVKYVAQNEEVKNKMKETLFNKNMKKYNEKYKDISIDIKNNLKKYIKNNRIDANKVCEDFNLHYNEVYIIDKYFKVFSNYEIHFNNTFISKSEKEIVEYIKSIYDNEIIENDRKILEGKELDIYVPDKNFAIEYDGIYYHSYGSIEEIDKKYHLNKTIKCEENDIHLFHIFENEWLDSTKKDIWKSKIAIKLHSKKLNKLNGRYGIIKEIDSKIAKEFLNENHLQGYTPSSIKLGFYIDNILYGVMTFNKLRFKKDEYELIRFSTKKYHIIRGLFSKFIKYFKKNYNINNLISYGNRRWTYKNNVYNSLMELESISNPNYFYVKNIELYNKIKFQKNKLKNILEDFNPNKTEVENMLNNKYRIIYDCGNYKYRL